ncbi:MAG: LD-carboxypeptidase, partial [Crocinitomicaceae bacterium]|nr:LD-carboxypeptidase [Crocinitomicaceae bacterium]
MRPAFLQPGDTIGIVATARWITNEQLQAAQKLFTQWGFKIKTSRHLMTRNYQLAGNTEERLADLQALLDNPSVKAIVIARGGYGTVHLIDRLNWDKFIRHPKWICGYSDITLLLNDLSNRGISAIHSTMPVSFHDATEEAINHLLWALTGKLNEIRWEGYSNIPGKTIGNVVGGNLSVICSQLGSSTSLQTTNSILFLEDVDEMYYHVDRMMVAIQRAGLLEGIAGVIVGGLTKMRDNTKEFGFPTDNPWGKNAEETLLSFFEPLRVPVSFGFPAG